ncbi:MAG: Hpt domain-containing protein [Elusimicrobia bacterium]|nr:Hpt domain-containing protein [Elusimicrobiota bacterium]
MTNSFNLEPEEKIVVHIDPEIRVLVPAFLEHTHQNVKVMKSALAADDLTSIYQTAHKLKGSTKLYGFSALGDIASSLEQTALRQETEAVSKWIDEFTYTLDHLQIIYD